MSLTMGSKRVVVEEITGTQAIVRDELGKRFSIPAKTMRASSALPRVGQIWRVDQTLGTWTFAARENTTPPALTEFSPPESHISLAGYRAQLMGAPIAGTDGVNKTYSDDGDTAARAYADTIVAGLMNGNARVSVRINSGANAGTRRRINFIPGTGIALLGADDVTDEEVELTISHGVVTSGDHHSEYVQESLVTTKGDLLVATAAAVLARLAIGANNTVLIADSAQTPGLKWAVLDHSLTGGLSDNDHPQYLRYTQIKHAVQGVQQSTTSATYTDLATVGPQVSITLNGSGTIMVILTSEIENTGSVDDVFMGFELTGASSQPGSDGLALRQSGSGNIDRMSAVTWSGVNAGTTTVTAKYRAAGGTARFANRELFVIARND